MPEKLTSYIPAAAGPTPWPQPPVDSSSGWYVSAAVAVVAAIMWLRRRVSRDSTEMIKDRAEENIIERLSKERDTAMAAAAEAWDRRTKDAEEIAGLRAENVYLKRDVERLGADVNRLTSDMHQMMAAVRRLIPDFELEPRSF